MQVEISASGTPAKVNVAVASQVKAAGNPDNWPTLVSARDYIAKLTNEAGPSDLVTVQAAITIKVEIEKDAVSSVTSGTKSTGAPVAEPEPPDGN